MSGTPVQNTDVWSVAALSAMPEEKLRSLLSGEPHAAAPWVAAAARCGLVEAQMRYGRMLLEGEGTAKDETAAFEWFCRAARSNDPDANNMVGRCFENGWGVVPSAVRAAEFYQRAAEAGHAWAQYNLGHLLLDGNGVARDPARAFHWYSCASAQGHVRAMNLVARCYEEGWGVARDAGLAASWYRKSAEGGYFRGAYNYATLLANEGSLTAAAEWFEKALAEAYEPTRSNMIAALAKSPHAALRVVAQNVSRH